MPISKKAPASAGKPSQRKPATKEAPAKASMPLERKTGAKAAQNANVSSQRLQKEPDAVEPKKNGKAAAKNSKSKKNPVLAAKVDSVSAAKQKSKAVKGKPKKDKLVRDSFTMPESEYQAIGEIKKACIKAGFAIKKSEVLRIGVALARKLSDSQLQDALSALPALKAGRPKKDGADT